jgi:hypothetical protein
VDVPDTRGMQRDAVAHGDRKRTQCNAWIHACVLHCVLTVSILRL